MSITPEELKSILDRHAKWLNDAIEQARGKV